MHALETLHESELEAVKRIVDEDSVRYFYEWKETSETAMVTLTTEGIILESFLDDHDGNEVLTGSRHMIWDELLEHLVDNASPDPRYEGGKE